MDVPALAEREFSLLLPCYSIRALNGLLVMPIHIAEGSLLSLLIQMLISSRGTLTDTWK